jgi:anti-sigma regulatory factor (Ser/Thr protein kinase)
VAKHQATQIRDAILARVAEGIASPLAGVANSFGVTRQAVHRHARHLVEEGLLATAGSGRATRYSLTVQEDHKRTLPLTREVAEDAVYSEVVRPIANRIDSAAADICHYGFTEIVNNAVDHSEGRTLTVGVSRTAASIAIEVHDDGVGIFDKIAKALALTDSRQSLLELSKGKFTTDPARHTGEGIFFTSRAFDRFAIVSGELLFEHKHDQDDWLLEYERQPIGGTRVFMTLMLPARRTLLSVFEQFSSGPDEHAFAKTHVPVRLARYGDEHLVSRSQAKRVLNRFDRFAEVMLDFEGIRSIGQAFADEIFRVFANANPGIRLRVVRDNPEVRRMIRRAQAARQEGRHAGL